ncbi:MULTISPECIES: hypothetical protein [Frankia]|uniref:Oxidoreductase molybdopterin-binding domain-containing protein n=1 Tax=Frankia alni (strain DSM 45986 / CECT 9034 / ACN14a) TaxID=326424 RepID=Q0RNS0_FRAAA|nr:MULTISPECIES: hypothetical protein [Frankia]CAJ60816.1 conserved hypothetical protein; putative signal peptide [Frankia alni ACN14a]
MSRPRVVAIVLALAAILVVSLLPTWRAEAATPAATPAPAAAAAPAKAVPHPLPTLPPGRVVLLGRIAHPVLLTVADLAAKYPQHTQTVSFQSGAGPQTHTYTGPLLYDVLQAAKPALRSDVKNDALRYAAVVHASDGYESVVSWGEIDPGFANTEALLAVTQDGVSLAKEGPRLTAPGDTKGGRYVSGVTAVTLVRAGL